MAIIVTRRMSYSVIKFVETVAESKLKYLSGALICHSKSNDKEFPH